MTDNVGGCSSLASYKLSGIVFLNEAVIPLHMIAYKDQRNKFISAMPGPMEWNPHTQNSRALSGSSSKSVSVLACFAVSNPGEG